MLKLGTPCYQCFVDTGIFPEWDEARGNLLGSPNPALASHQQ